MREYFAVIMRRGTLSPFLRSEDDDSACDPKNILEGILNA
jgi:hypothetical protein